MVYNHATLTQEEVSNSPIFEAMVSFFKQENWYFSKDDDKPILRMNFLGNNGSWRCIAQAIEEYDSFIFYSSSPVSVPEGKRLSMAEFLTRVNSGLILGNFELDFNSGQIYYKTSISVKGSHLDAALIEQLVYTNVRIMDKYLPGMMKVIYADVSAAEAVAQIEG